MDLEYLREHPETIDRLIEHQRIRVTTLGHNSVCTAMRLTLDDGTDLFAKTRPDAPTNFFRIEADGVQYLAEAGGPATPEVIAATDEHLVLEWVEHANPTPRAAEKFGRALTTLHRTPAEIFGARGVRESGFIGSLPLDNRPLDTWPFFFIERRCRPYLRAAYDAGVFTDEEKNTVEAALRRAESLLKVDEPPARTHGDLWGGNVLYSRADTAFLVDAAAAAGGNREIDLANLALFGAAHLGRLMEAYREAYPLADGWQERISTHQLHLLLVHCVLFGRSYVPQTLAACQRRKHQL